MIGLSKKLAALSYVSVNSDDAVGGFVGCVVSAYSLFSGSANNVAAV